jgi:cytochrome b6-f complex iron-sulfur subunit
VAFIIVGIVVVLGGAFVMLLATGRRRATTGRLSRETRQRDEGTPSVGTELATVDESDEARARANEARAATGAVPAKRASSGVARYEPVDPEELGVTRRQFFNRGVLTGLALGVSGFGAAALAFLWPSQAGGSGTKVTVGSISDVEASFEKKEPVLQRQRRRCTSSPYPKDALRRRRRCTAVSPACSRG